jgi:putative ABC transport system permease protein
MLRSFLLITLRILWRNKVTSFVNIFSLSVGMTAFMFIMLYVLHETSYDKFHKNYHRIYRLEADEFGKLPPVIGNHVKDNVPEVENVAMLSNMGKGYFSYSRENDPENLKQVELDWAFADSTTFNVFTFSFLAGDPSTALKEPMATVLTESAARKLFGDIDPIGLTVEFDHNPYIVTGVIRDVTSSHIEIDALLSMVSVAKIFPEKDLNRTAPNSWLWSATYLLMTEGINEKIVEDKINKELKEFNDGKLVDTEFKHFHIRPLRDLYFNGEVQKLSYGLHGNLRTIQVLTAIGMFMLVLAGINYVNLTTARSTIRAKEIAVKRVTGSSANLLRVQLIGESVIISLVSLVVALTTMQLFLPWYNQLTSVNIQIAELNRPLVWVGLVSAGLLIGIIAGVYPAFYLTSIKPVRLIKGARVRDGEGSLFRSGLMTFQFALSIVMIVAIIVNYRQLHYLKTADLGFNKEQVVTLNTPADLPDEFVLREAFKKRLSQHAEIENISYSYGSLGGDIADMPSLEINGTRKSVKFLVVDEDYLKVMGISLTKGRDFSPDHPGDVIQPDVGNTAGTIINESMVNEFGIDNPIGKKLYKVEKKFAYEIVGVVNDFHVRSLRDKIEPVMLVRFVPGNLANIKIASANIPATLKVIESEWKSVWGAGHFNFEFLDETFDRQYSRDEQLATAIGYFTILAMIIASLGLFALSSFTVSRRIKEIGVRKTLGASVIAIYSMLSWDFLKWILVALAFAVPVAGYVMHLWLETFAYHIGLTIDVFVIAGLVTTGIALLTVTAQSLKAANANPIDSLRYE